MGKQAQIRKQRRQEKNAMRYLIVPEDVQLVDELTGELLRNSTGELAPTQTFKAFVIRTLLNDPENFGKHADQLEARMRIIVALKNALPGALLELESTDWELLKAAAQSPGAIGAGGVVKGYIPNVGSQILPFIRAIKDATERKPEATTAT